VTGVAREDLAARLAAAAGPGPVLDAASGGGASCSLLRELLPEAGPVIAADVDPAILSRSAERLRALPDVLPVGMDARMPCFPDGSFGLVSISNSLHHLTDPGGSLAALSALLRPGGLLLVREMVRDGLSEAQTTHLLLHDWWADIDRALGTPHFPTFTRAEIGELLALEGMERLLLDEDGPPEGDPRDPHELERLGGAVEGYLEKAAGLPGERAFRERGGRLRERLGRVGIHPASTLTALLGRSGRDRQ